MNRQKKPFKFYLVIFLLSALIIAIFSVYSIFVKGTPVSEIYTIWFMPLVFSVFYWGSDTLILKFSKRRKKIDYEAKFLDEVSELMRNSKDFLVEDFRRLQINPKFQEDLRRAYTILKDGENEVLTIEKLENKYKKNTVEKKAMQYVVMYLKEKMELTETE